MSEYTITHDTGMEIWRGQAPCPEQLPYAGDVLEVLKPFWTLGEYHYEVGDTLTLVQRTRKAPFGRSSSLGNWIVKDKYQESLWCNIEWMLADGIVKVKS